MSDSITIITNNVPRFTEDTADGRTVFSYKGSEYDLDEFCVTSGIPALREWDGYAGDSFFSGILVRFPENSTDSVIVGRYYA